MRGIGQPRDAASRRATSFSSPLVRQRRQPAEPRIPPPIITPTCPRKASDISHFKPAPTCRLPERARFPLKCTVHASASIYLPRVCLPALSELPPGSPRVSKATPTQSASYRARHHALPHPQTIPRTIRQAQPLSTPTPPSLVSPARHRHPRSEHAWLTRCSPPPSRADEAGHVSANSTCLPHSTLFSQGPSIGMGGEREAPRRYKSVLTKPGSGG